MIIKIIDVNACNWQGVSDFYKDVLEQIGAPDWHGGNVNALIDSMIYGGINALKPPYIIRFHETDGLATEIIEELNFVKAALEGARLEQINTTGLDANVVFELV